MKGVVKCEMCGAEIVRNPTKTNTYFCNINCKAKWQIYQRELLGYTKEWLIDQYFVQGKDCTEIGKEINRDPKSVWNWFKVYGIKINKRGSSKKQQFKKGHKLGIGRVQKEETRQKIRKSRIEDGRLPCYVNGIHWLKYYSDRKPGSWRGGITPERQSFYSSEEWSKAVKIVWKRDNAICKRCGINQNDNKSMKFHIHHIISFKCVEERCNPDNLILLCPNCHRWVHSKKNKNNELIIEKNES